MPTTVYRQRELLQQCMHPQKAAALFIYKRTGQDDLIACKYSILQISACVLPFYISTTETQPVWKVQARLHLSVISSGYRKVMYLFTWKSCFDNQSWKSLSWKFVLPENQFKIFVPEQTDRNFLQLIASFSCISESKHLRISIQFREQVLR